MSSAASPTPFDRRRVLLAEMPRLLSDVLQHALASAPDLEVCVDVSADLRTALAKYDPAIAVIGVSAASDADEARGVELLSDYPKLRILLLNTEENACRAFEMRPAEAVLGELGTEQLIEVVRSGAKSGVWNGNLVFKNRTPEAPSSRDADFNGTTPDAKS